MKGDETLDILSHLLTVLPPHGEDADEEGERGHDNLTTSLSTTFSRLFSNHHLPGLGGTEFTVATEHLPEYIYDYTDLRLRIKLSQWLASLNSPDRGGEHCGQSGERPCGCQGSEEESVRPAIYPPVNSQLCQRHSGINGLN